MSSQDTTTPTPPEVIENATVEAHLPRLAVIGIFGTTEHPQALIRRADGGIERVSVGDRVAGGEVKAIGDTRVLLALPGEHRVLRMPTA